MAIELEKFNTHFIPRTAIKTRALVNFMVKLNGLGANPEAPQNMRKWNLYTDSACNKMGSGASIVLQTPEGLRLEKAITFDFKASNKEAKYEALLIGMQFAKVCRALFLKAHYDSQFVVGQVQGEFKVN